MHLDLKFINLSLPQLPRTDLLLKEDIQLRKTEARGLPQAEVRVQDAEEADTAPEETGPVLPVPLARVELVRGDDGAHDAGNEVQCFAKCAGRSWRLAIFRPTTQFCTVMRKCSQNVNSKAHIVTNIVVYQNSIVIFTTERQNAFRKCYTAHKLACTASHDSI